MIRLIVLGALLASTAATAQVEPAGNGNGGEPATAFRDTKEEVERNQLLGGNGNRPAARRAIDAYGKCAARRERSEAERLLAMDFKAQSYKTGLQALSRDAERNCASDALAGHGTLRSAELLFGGAIAEALVEANPTALNARLAMAAGHKVEPFAPTDAIALCLSRSVPDQVAKLLASEPGSTGEATAALPLQQAVPVCARAAGIASKVELSDAALRAMVATAAYRLLAAPAG